jgi:hypothetical protein
MTPFRPMTQFDPSRPALVHDRLNAKTFEWSPEWRASFERYKREAGLGVFHGTGCYWMAGPQSVQQRIRPHLTPRSPAGVPRLSPQATTSAAKCR